MESRKIFAIISIIIGLIFIIFPMFSANLISILIGAAVFIFGLGLAYTGIISKDISPAVSTVSASVIGLLGGAEINKTGSIIGLILGIVILFIAVFAANNPILITIILGIALIAYGVVGYLHADEY